MDEKEIARLAKIKPENRTEAHWQAIYDARSLMEANIINKDEARLKNAKLWAGVLLQEETDQTEALKEVANG